MFAFFHLRTGYNGFLNNENRVANSILKIGIEKDAELKKSGHMASSLASK
jgi:hypothetical protein